MTMVFKTHEPPAEEASTAQLPAAGAEQAWWQWVDERILNTIEADREEILESCAMALADTMRGWNRRFLELEKQITIARDELKVASGLAALREEVDVARKRQPRYEKQLSELRDELASTKDELARTRKTLSKERVTLSVLKRQVTEMEKDQRRDRRATATLTETVSTLTVDVDVDRVGDATRREMARLRADGAALGESRTIFAWRTNDEAVQ
jgi:chromosome segregation ATPase